MSARRHPNAGTTSTQPTRTFTFVKALSLVGSLTVSVGGLMTVSSVIASPAHASPLSCSAPSGPGLQQNINTDQGCDVAAGTSLMSGYISDSGLAPNQQVTLEDAYEGLSSHLFYYGEYSLALSCSPGSASPAVSNYVIQQGTGSFPSTPPTVSSGTLPKVTADSIGSFVCSWSMSVQNAPGGHLNSSKSDLWVVAGGSDHTATMSVKPPVLTDPPTGGTTGPTGGTTGPTTVPPTTDPTTDPTSTPTTVTVTTDPGPTDPGTTPPTDPTTSVTPTTDTSTTDPSSTRGSKGVTTTTAPVVHTGTESDPASAFGNSNDPTTTGDPHGSGSPASPSTPSSFNPHGLSALAFTGSISETLAVLGLMLIAAGALILGFTRKWRSARP